MANPSVPLAVWDLVGHPLALVIVLAYAFTMYALRAWLLRGTR